MAYDVGDMIRVGNWSGNAATAAFTVLSGTATDPTAVTLTVQRPDATQLIYGYPSAGTDGTLTRESAGRFYRDVILDAAGVWYWRLDGTGAVTAAAEGAFYVQPTAIVEVSE